MTALVRRPSRPGVDRALDDRGWLWMAAAFGLTGAAQLLLQVVVARLLGPAEFGEVATLLNLMNLVGIPLVALQLATTGVVARGGSERALARRALAASVGAALVATAIAPWWTGWIAVGSVPAGRLTAWFVPAAVAVAVARGRAVGLGRSGELATAMSIAAVVRVGAGTVAAVELGAPGVVAVVVAAEALIAGVLSRERTRERVRSQDETPGGELARNEVERGELTGAAYTQVAVWLAVNVDLLWARTLLDESDAGRYLAVGGVAVGLVSFGQAFLWHHAASSTDPAAGPGIVRRAAAIVAAVGIVAVPLAAWLLPVVLGDEYRGLTPLLALAGVWAVLASVCQTSAATRLIASRRGMPRLVVAAAFAVVAPPCWIALFGDRPVVLSMAAVTNAAVAALVVAPRRRGVTS